VNALSLFLPCAAGVQEYLAAEVLKITGIPSRAWRAGVALHGSWRDALALNLRSRLAQRVLVQLAQNAYRNEQDLYNAAGNVAWELWFSPQQTFKVEVTAQHSPLQSLNFATLRIKDAIADRFRAKFNDQRPSVETRWPDVRIYAHLTTDSVTLHIDTTGEPLFKRGWREDKGDAPLKETLAAAMIAASGWEQQCKEGVPLYDPCCGSGTIVVEAAQIACNMAPGLARRFGFEKLHPFQAHVWQAMRQQAQSEVIEPTAPVFGSDVSFRMVDFAQRNAERAGVAHAVQLRGGDALQRPPPATGGVMLLNPPYGERIEVSGVAGARPGQLRRAERARNSGPTGPRPGAGGAWRGEPVDARSNADCSDSTWWPVLCANPKQPSHLVPRRSEPATIRPFELDAPNLPANHGDRLRPIPDNWGSSKRPGTNARSPQGLSARGDRHQHRARSPGLS